MRDRGKREVESYNNNNNQHNNGECYYAENFPEFPCKKHPSSASSSSGGICAYCLTDRLAQLVCPQCGEQRLSSSCSCSCSEIFSNASATDVGRISFLLENDQHRPSEISGSRPKNEQHRYSNYSNDEYIISNNTNTANFRRSNSISVAAAAGATHHDVINNKGKKPETGKLWKIGRLFRKKRDNKTNNPNKNSSSNYNNVHNNNNNNNNEENYECNGVSRSRSLCSFRGFYDPEENGGFPVSNSAARASSVSTGNFMLDSAKISCFSESEARISNFDYYDASNFVSNPTRNSNSNNNNSNIFSLKETEFVSCDDPAFIDLKLNESNSNNNNSNNNYSNFNYSSNSMSDHYYRVPDLAAMRRSGLGLSTKEYGYRGGGHEDMLRNGGGSCRISDVSERDLRKVRKSYKVWKWFSKHNHPSTTSSKFDDHDFKS